MTVSDAKTAPASLAFSKGYDSGVKEYTLNPVFGKIDGSDINKANGQSVANAREILSTSIWHGSNDGSGYHTNDHKGTKLVPVCAQIWAHKENELFVYAVDQYGRNYDPKNGEGLEDIEKFEVEFTISDVVENTNALAHMPKSFVVQNNGTENASVEGAEIGDTFKLTAKLKGTNISASINIKVGADKAAYIDEKGAGSKQIKDEHGTVTTQRSKDAGLRDLLGYDR